MGAPRAEREREEEMRAGTEGMGAKVEEPLFLPTPAVMASAEEDGACALHLSLLWCDYYPLRQAWVDGKGKLATRHLRADSGGEAVGIASRCVCVRRDCLPA
jgi:hypothetical protein